MNIAERILKIQEAEHRLSLVSDDYERAWTANFENPTALTKYEVEYFGRMIEEATNLYLDVLERRPS